MFLKKSKVAGRAWGYEWQVKFICNVLLNLYQTWYDHVHLTKAPFSVDHTQILYKFLKRHGSELLVLTKARDQVHQTVDMESGIGIASGQRVKLKRVRALM